MSRLPPGWVESTLGDVCLPVSKHDPRDRPDEQFSYIDIGGISANRIVETKVVLGSEAPSRARQIVIEGDTVLSTVRTYLKKTAIVPADLDGATASTGFSVLRPAEGIEPRFVYYRVIEGGFVAELSTRQTGSSYPAVRDRDVFTQPISLPPSNEQRRIVAAIEEHLSRLDAADESVSAARLRLDGLAAARVRHATGGNWPTMRLGDLTRDQIYGTSAKANTDPSGVPVLRMGNIQAGRLDLSDLKYLPADHPDVLKLKLEPGDLLFNRTNSSELVGKSAVFSQAPRLTVFASYLIRVRLGPDCDPEWAALVINGPVGRRYIATVRTQQVGQANVNGTKLAAMPMPCPPVDEQRRIVAQVEEELSAVDALRAALERAQRRSGSLRRAILEQAFCGELVSQDPSDEPASVLLDRIRTERAVTPLQPRRRRVNT